MGQVEKVTPHRPCTYILQGWYFYSAVSGDHFQVHPPQCSSFWRVQIVKYAQSFLGFDGLFGGTCTKCRQIWKNPKIVQNMRITYPAKRSGHKAKGSRHQTQKNLHQWVLLHTDSKLLPTNWHSSAEDGPPNQEGSCPPSLWLPTFKPKRPHLQSHPELGFQTIPRSNECIQVQGNTINWFVDFKGMLGAISGSWNGWFVWENGEAGGNYPISESHSLPLEEKITVTHNREGGLAAKNPATHSWYVLQKDFKQILQNCLVLLTTKSLHTPPKGGGSGPKPSQWISQNQG